MKYSQQLEYGNRKTSGAVVFNRGGESRSIIDSRQDATSYIDNRKQHMMDLDATNYATNDVSVDTPSDVV